MAEPSTPSTIRVSTEGHVVTVTLNRPEVLNAFNRQMCDEFLELWQQVAVDDDVHVVVLRSEHERAFSTGVDQRSGMAHPENIWVQTDPGMQLGPKANGVWKPFVCALHGMVAGGAFYWVNEADIVVCTPDTTFFEPHLTYGMTAAAEPIGLTHRIPLGEVLRMVLLGLDERMSAERALQIGLVTEIVERDELDGRVAELARLIAAKPPAAVQGSLRAIWESLDLGRRDALARAHAYTQLGNLVQLGNAIGKVAPDAMQAKPASWRLR